MTAAKVLLAEDDESFRFMMAEVFDELGVAYDVVTNGQECFDKIFYHSRNYRLVLMDIHMPVKSGPEALRLIRDEVPVLCQFVPIIALTADRSWQDKRKVVEAGFSGVLLKPVRVEKLISILKALI